MLSAQCTIYNMNFAELKRILNDFNSSKCDYGNANT